MRRGFLVKRRSDDVPADPSPAAINQGQLPEIRHGFLLKPKPIQMAGDPSPSPGVADPLPGMKRGFLLKPCTARATAVPPATTAKSTEAAATVTAPSKLERDLRNGHLHPGSGERGTKTAPLGTKRATKQEHSGLPSPGSSGTPSPADMPTLPRLPKPPLKCKICQYDIQSHEVLFWVECWNSCQLYLHCPCFHYSLLALDMDPAEQLKMAKCYNFTCSAKLMNVSMCSVDYDGVPNIKYRAKLDMKGRIVSEEYNVTPEQGRKAREEPHVDAKSPHCTPPSSIETGNVEPADGKKEKKNKKKRKSSKSHTNKKSESKTTNERQNIQKHNDSVIPAESTEDKMQEFVSSEAHQLGPIEEDVEVVQSPEYQEAVVEDHQIPPLLNAVRVQPASEIDAVPLLHREDGDIEKNAVVENPPMSSSKHTIKRNRAVSIDHLVTDRAVCMNDVTPEEARERDRSEVDDRSRSGAVQCPKSADIQRERRHSAVASSEMAPDCLTQLEEFTVRSLLQCVEPYSRQLAAYTPDYAQPVERLKEAIETVVELHRYHQKLLDKVFSSDTLLRLFIHKLRIFVVSRTRGQVMFAKSNYAKVLEKEARISTTISASHAEKREPRSTHPSSNNHGGEVKRILQHDRANNNPHGLSERSDDLKPPLKGIAAKCDYKKATSPLSRLPSNPWKTVDHSDKARRIAVEERMCQICLETFNYDSQLLHCPNKSCGEPYHVACVRPWLAYQAKCPQCRWSWPDPVDFPEVCAARGIKS